MRADRLVATVLLLQHRGRVTAAEVAAELEVSVATARRDLEALSAAGVPVYPQPGRGGGWQLVGGGRTDLSGLSAGESEALFLLLGPAATARPEARTALSKLVRALPATFRDDAQAAARAVVIDPDGWGSNSTTGVPTTDPNGGRTAAARGHPPTGRADRLSRSDRDHHAAGDRAVRTGRQGRHLVRGGRDRPGSPHVPGRSDGRRRTARRDVQSTGRPRPPHRLAPDRGRRRGPAVGGVGHRPGAAEVGPAAADPVRPLPRDPRHPRRPDDLRVGANLVVALAEQLAGWGAQVEVVEPPELRAELGRIGAELTRAYG